MALSTQLTKSRYRSATRNFWIRAAACCFSILGLSATGCFYERRTDESNAGRPNILFILSDDQRFDAVGYSGNTILKTPHLDQLASQGMRLDRFYVASPVCIPSRGTFLTGRYYNEKILVQKGKEVAKIRPGISTVADLLNQAGYVTGFIGKTHLGGGPASWGFNRVPATMPTNFWGVSQHIDPDVVVEGVKKRVKGHVTQIYIDAAMGFIEDNTEKPWFLWLATTAPHSPYNVFENYKYTKDEIIGNPPPGWPKKSKLVVRNSVFDWPAYYSTISMLDEQIGRLLRKLDDLGLADNTVVIFTSDNGIQIGSHGHLGKAIWYEESTRVPAVVRWPGKVEAGTVNLNLVSAVDFLPTVLDIAGLEVPSGLRSKSFLPLLTRNESVRQYAFSESFRVKVDGGGFWHMVVSRRWKYVEFKDMDEKHLYDLESDPHELKDLIHSKEHASIIKKLRSELSEWSRSRA